MTDLPLDPDRIRAEFPAFRQPDLRDFAHFENAGGSYTCAPVLNRMRHFYWNTKVQPGHPFAPSREAQKAMDESWRRIAAAMNVPQEWIHFGPSTSANTYTLAHAFEGWLRPGDAIVVTNQDHEANSGVWRKLVSRGVEIREWSIEGDTGHLALAALDKLLDSKVRLICMPHVSNIVGEINPVAEVTRRAHALGAISIVDGVSYAPHGVPDVLALGCDIYLFSAYKVYGPHQGIMAIRPSVANELPNQSHFFNAGVPRKRLNPAGPDHAQIGAAGGIADYLETVAAIAGDAFTGSTLFHKAHKAMRAQETVLLAPLLDYLRGKNGVRLIGPADPEKRAPTVSIVTDKHPHAIAEALGKRSLGVGAGNFYGYRCLQALGLDPERGVLRMSFVHYTTPAEVQRLISALDAEL
ncbi:MAG TPA: aminotransferase class V-fold PLP-dependent enzyme [Devosia sp.]|nr:aminotransferase class V-fold PLP-dependent enzyme [Devosia sp.]